MATRNGKLTPDKVSYGNNEKKSWWICSKGHEWLASPYNRVIGIRCPYCSGKKASIENCLATIKPKLTTEWHPARNSHLTPYDVTPFSSKKVWWVCLKGHEWEMKVKTRVQNSECPYCTGRRHYRNISIMNYIS